MKLQEKDGAVLVQVKVVPNSSRTQVAGMLGEAVKIKVTQPPEGGKANAAVERLLAEILGVAQGDVKVDSGHTRPVKTIRVVGLSAEDVRHRLTAALNAR